MPAQDHAASTLIPDTYRRSLSRRQTGKSPAVLLVSPFRRGPLLRLQMPTELSMHGGAHQALKILTAHVNNIRMITGLEIHIFTA